MCIPGACFLPVQEGGLAPLPMSGPFPAAMLWACPESPFPETLSKAISYFTGNFYLPFVNSSLIIFPLKHCLGQSGGVLGKSSPPDCYVESKHQGPYVEMLLEKLLRWGSHS